MSSTSTAATAIVMALAVISSTSAFSVLPKSRPSSSQLYMGLFDGVKDAFSAPALERSVLDAERETPIDRWFGWSVQGEEQTATKGELVVLCLI